MKRTFFLAISLLPVAALAQNSYFGGKDIDYWNKGNRVQAWDEPVAAVPGLPTPTPTPGPQAASSAPLSPRIRDNDARPFSWDDYNDPRKPTYWDDGGDYIPPRPYRELVANPTKENAKKYIEWQVSKMKSVETFTRALASVGSSPSAPASTQSRQPSSSVPRQAFDWRKVDVLYFYLTTCPYCKRNLPEVAQLKTQGARLVAIQIDVQNPLLIPGAVPFDDAMKSQFQIAATPTWIMMAGGHMERAEQYLSMDSLTAMAKRLF